MNHSLGVLLALNNALADKAPCGVEEEDARRVMPDPLVGADRLVAAAVHLLGCALRVLYAHHHA